jgi:ethanolamine transporter EutH
MMSFSTRFVAYSIAWLLITCGIVAFSIAKSVASDDPSAGAWIGFLPLIFPLFMGHTAVLLAPVAVGIEIALFLKRR